MAKDFTTLTSSEMYPIFIQETKAALLVARVWKHANIDVKAPKQTSPPPDRLDGKRAHEAWTILSTTHVTETANRQYQLYQELAKTRQQPNEALPAYLQQIQQAADRLSASLASGTTADNIISMLTTFLTISNLEPTKENESFKLNHLWFTGKVDSATIAESFRTEQMRRCHDPDEM
ncbi:hypothetical protein M407DRAFT_23435 [Tulasnella calospora MUT 4182]|uniref:Uncharacterized protein n=1 Tax=Tulasnella calospora MUT 4182 TaxID=1051891 RepID=A0A0C3QJG9_9AGAM|nr:hypothetical protein M407DRAFT_23435 [Tulasnella calospora MUT 4182]